VFQANLGYVFWTVAFNVTYLLAYLVVDLVYFSSTNGSAFSSSSAADGSHAVQNSVRGAPSLFEAVNRHGLAIFLFVRFA
jgi:phosphatidylinositol glycan class W